MATKTLAALRSLLANEIGDYWSLTADSGTTTTIVDTELADLTGGGDDDFCADWWVIVTSGNNDGEIRRVASYASSTNTITVSRAFTNAIATHTYELHRHAPVDYNTAIQRATRRVWPDLYLPVQDQSITVDNLLSNQNFNTFSSGFTSWTEVGSPTVTQETTIAMEGGSSAKVVASGAAGQLTQAPTVNVPTIEGKTVTAACWAYTVDASAVRLRIDWDGGTTFTNGDYHTGADGWEAISVTGVVPAGATQVKLICEVADGSTGYFDKSYLVIEPIYRYTLDSNLLLGPYYVMQQLTDDPNSPFRELKTLPVSGRTLRLIGKGLLSNPSADTDTVEVNDAQAELLVAKALWFFRRMQVQRAATQQRQRFVTDMNEADEEYNRLVREPGRRSPVTGASMAMGLNTRIWHVEETSSGRELVFDVTRGSTESRGFTQLV